MTDWTDRQPGTHLPPEDGSQRPTIPPAKPSDAARSVMTPVERLQRLAAMPGPVGNERTFPLDDVRAVLKERALIAEELRIREQSQIPVIPSGAAGAMRKLQAVVDTQMEVLSRIAYAAPFTSARKLRQMAKEGLWGD